MTKRATEHDIKDYALARLSSIVYNALAGEDSIAVDELDMLIKFDTSVEAVKRREHEIELQEQKDESYFKALEVKYGGNK